MAEKLLRCPKCGARDVRPSYHRGAMDTLMAMLSMNPFRCRACTKRFFRRLPRSQRDSGEQDAAPAGGEARDTAE